MFFDKSEKYRIMSGLLALFILSGSSTAFAAEKGVVQKFTTNKSAAAKTEKLWNEREFSTRQLEYLNRGLVAVKSDYGIFVSWRWLGTESNATKYNLYRDGKRINAFPLNITNFTDTGGTLESHYSVAAVVDGVEQEKCDEVSPWEDNKLEIPLTDKPKAVNPDGSQKLNDDGSEAYYEPTETSIADLDGDGELEIVLKWDPSDRKDNSMHGLTSPTILDAYKLDGTKMWRINLGYNIRSGSHYTQFMVYDLDLDGKAELVCKTADGTTDNEGNTVGDADKIWRDGTTGRILSGPEYLTAFNAETGTIIDTTEYIPGRGNVADWGDEYGNRVDRFLACVAYLDGKTPSVVVGRGYYTRMAITAYGLVDGKLTKQWAFDTDKNKGEYMGQGNHSIAVADVDMDGRDEIIYGAAVIDDNGEGLYSIGLGHGDAQHTGDLIPDRPGLEIFSVHEESDAEFGVEMRDARTGEIIWGSYENADVGRGVSDDIDPNYPGAESWAADKMVSASGELIYEKPSISQNFLIYWDGDLGREVQDGNHIDKWVPEKNKTQLLFTAKGYESNNGTKATPGITCDILGDWREETILFKSDDTAMAIFTTTEPTDYKIYTLMHDLQYRTYIATQNVGYNQPPHVGYYLGFDTEEIPVSRAMTVHDGITAINPELEKGTKFYPIESLVQSAGVSMVVNEPFALSNGSMMRIDSENIDIVPYISNDRTLVPLRFIAEAFGATVDWNDAKREITIKQDKKTIKMVIDSKAYTINRKAAELDVPATIKEDRTFIPLRAVAEALGKKVAWDSRGIIHISDDLENVTEAEGTILYDSIVSYVEPENINKGPVAIETEQLNAKQIPVFAVEATADDGNIAEGAVDGNFSTRWNAFGDGSALTIDFNEIKDVAAVAAAYYKGDQRQYYFDIAVSTDGENWSTVLKNQASSGTAGAQQLEMFKFSETLKARYIKYIGHGSSTNDSNNIWEFIAIAP